MLLFKLPRNHAREILEGVKHLHDLGIVHGDIKPANIVSSFHRIKIIDFGSATQTLGTQQYYLPPKDTTIRYTSPELLHAVRQGRSLAAAQLKANDIWAVGCTLLFLASGKHPWDDFCCHLSQDDEKYGSSVKNHIIDMLSKTQREVFENVSSKWKGSTGPMMEFLRRFFKPAGDRPSADQLLNHEWLKQPAMLEAGSDEFSCSQPENLSQTTQSQSNRTLAQADDERTHQIQERMNTQSSNGDAKGENKKHETHRREREDQLDEENPI